MAEFKMDKEHLEDTIQTILNLIGNQLILTADSKTVCPLGETWRETTFTLSNHQYTMVFDGKNYWTLSIANTRWR